MSERVLPWEAEAQSRIKFLKDKGVTKVQAGKIHDQVLVIIFPERRIKKDLMIKEDLHSGKIPEYLVSCFFIRHYMNLKEDLKDSIHEYYGKRLPDDWDKARLRLNVSVSSGEIDIVLQSEKNYYIIEAKFRTQ